VAASIVQALIEVLHLGSLVSGVMSIARPIAASVHQVIPFEAQLQILMFLYGIGVVLYVVGLHRKAEKTVKNLYTFLAVVITVWFLIILGSPVVPQRDPTLLEHLVMWPSFLVAGYVFLFLPFRFMYKLWKHASKYPVLKHIKEKEAIWMTLLTIGLGFLLYVWWQWFVSMIDTGDPGNGLVAVGSALLFLPLGYIWVQMAWAALGEIINELRNLVNKI